MRDTPWLIEKIRRQGKTIIIAEHRLWYLTDIADRVILMQDGQIFKDMSIQDFCRLPVEQIQNTGLRCRNLSEIKTNTNGKKISEYSLELKDIYVKYGEKSILQNISFTASDGEIMFPLKENPLCDIKFKISQREMKY